MKDLDHFKENPDDKYVIRKITEIERRMFRKQDPVAWSHLMEIVRSVDGALPSLLIIHSGGTALTHVPMPAVWEDGEAYLVGLDGEEVFPLDVVEAVLGAPAGPDPGPKGA